MRHKLCNLASTLTNIQVTEGETMTKTGHWNRRGQRSNSLILVELMQVVEYLKFV